jgi:Na+/H+-dicarboxylate symporter
LTKPKSAFRATGWRRSLRPPPRSASGGRSQVWLTVWVAIALIIGLTLAALTSPAPASSTDYLVPGQPSSPKPAANLLNAQSR